MVVDGAMNPTRRGLPVLIAGRYLVGPLLGRGGAAEVCRAHCRAGCATWRPGCLTAVWLQGVTEDVDHAE